MIYRCPTCKGPVKAPDADDMDTAQFSPFCCERCKLIDLGAWLDGAYKISSPLEQDNPAPGQEEHHEV